MAKKKNSRKVLAVALGIMGIAGLSVASASSLPVTAGNEVAIGVDTFAPCDSDGVKVDYTYAKDTATIPVTSGYIISKVTVSGISTNCDGKDIRLTLADSTDAPIFTTGPTQIGASATTFVYDATSDLIDISKDLGKVTVIIG
ncbi:hypothetical protein [Demequina lutea]|uniref:Uncharacterized protein n=1 Tax=Demequina lutea TaxID=431489 RepID=A0A7Y9Z832_9MICO|nr:hypothetical protein [Demequina lutea]NYI40554.1 hypothetical protein [Demequina lutea]